MLMLEKFDWSVFQLGQPGLSADLDAARTEFNDVMREARAAITRDLEAIGRLIREHETPLAELETQLRKLRTQLRANWKTTLDAVKSGVESYLRFGPDLKKHIVAAESEFEKVKEQTRKKLRTAGLAPETQRNYGANPGVAEDQFEFLVTRKTEVVKQAEEARDQATENYNYWLRQKSAVTSWPATIALQLELATAAALNL